MSWHWAGPPQAGDPAPFITPSCKARIAAPRPLDETGSGERNRGGKPDGVDCVRAVHKLRNVLERLPKVEAAQTKAVMMAAYKLEAKDGMAKLRKQAQWLQREHADAAASLLEGLEETFTVNALGLPPSLKRCLCTTNIIENPNGIVRRTSRRVTRYRDADMVLRWTAAGFLEAQKSFRKIQGVKDLWILKAALDRGIEQARVDEPMKAA